MKYVKVILIILISFICIVGFMQQNVSNARTIVDVSEEFKAEEDDDNKVSYGTLKEVIGDILGFLQVATGLITVIIIATTGYSYIVATPDIKGEMKRKMLPMILGIILVFGAISISKFIVGAME